MTVNVLTLALGLGLQFRQLAGLGGLRLIHNVLHGALFRHGGLDLGLLLQRFLDLFLNLLRGLLNGLLDSLFGLLGLGHGGGSSFGSLRLSSRDLCLRGDLGLDTVGTGSLLSLVVRLPKERMRSTPSR